MEERGRENIHKVVGHCEDPENDSGFKEQEENKKQGKLVNEDRGGVTKWHRAP